MAYDIAAEVNDEIKKNLAAQEAADIQKEIENQRRTDFKSSLTVAAAFEPTKFAQALKVQRESGVPAKVAYDNWDQVESLKQEAKFAGLFSAAPRTSEALSKPEHAILAKGDEENLRLMEEASDAADFYKQGILERQILGPLKKWWNRDNLTDIVKIRARDEKQFEVFDEIDRAIAAGETPYPTLQERQSLGAFGLQYLQGTPENRAEIRSNLRAQMNIATDTARTSKLALQQMPVDPGDVALERAEGAAGVFGVIADDPMLAGRIAAQSLPDMAQGIVAGMINPLFGAASEGITASNYKLMEVLQEKGIDPADPIQLLQALRNDELLSEANERSMRYGAGIAVVSAASFGLLNRVLAPTKFNGRLLSNRTREGINVLAQVPAQGALEAGGELTGQIAERGQLSDVDAKEVALEGIVGGVMSLPEVGAFGTKRFTTHMIQARRAERAGKLQADLVEKSLQSSTRANDPASFEAIVSTQLAGRPNEYLEIPAAKLQELNQSGQVNIAELLENVGIDPEHYTAQVELGGTITIKNSAYLAYLAEQDEFLRGSIRVAGNEYTLDDVQEIDKQMLAEMEKIASQFGQTDQVATAYSDVMGQLLNAGYERGAADTTARQYAAVMTRLAEQTGQTVEEVMAANPLNIGRDVPAQVQRIREDQLSLMLGRLRAGDIPQPGDMFGKSLTEYLTSAGGIQDIGGELAAFDADVGKRGRNRLTRTDGMTLDDAAMQAWERGYFPGVAREDVTPNLLIDALREEAAGTPRYSVEQENATLRDQAQSLEALQEYLDREGIDLATATDDEIRQRLGVQPGNQRLDQDADRNLIAIHNLSAENLAFADKMGGIAVPSIGVVTKDSGGVEGFGEITLIGTRNLADPKQEPVFSSDAYTARFPKPEFKKAKAKEADAALRPLKSIAEEFGDVRVAETAFDYMVNDGDGSRAIDELMNSPAARALFLRENGISIEPAMRNATLETPFTPEQLLAMEGLIKRADKAARLDDNENPDVLEVERLLAEAIDKKHAKRPTLAAKIKDKLMEQPGWGALTVMGDLITAKRGPVVDTWETRTKTLRAIEDNGLSADFKRWVENKILPAMGEPLLTIGRSKVPYTLENIVEVMTRGPVRGQEKTMVFGAGQARAASSVEFSDVEQMREAAKRSIVDPKAYEEAKKTSEKLLDQYRDSVIEFTKILNWQGRPDTFEALDSSMRAIAKFSTKKKRDRAAMEAALRSEKFDVAAMKAAASGQTSAVNERAVKDIEAEIQKWADLLQKLEPGDSRIPEVERRLQQNQEALQAELAKAADQAKRDPIGLAMLAAEALLNAPVPYFEAKPQRAVSLSEFAGAVIPKSASEETRAILEKSGIPVIEYDSEEDRQQAVRQAALSFDADQGNVLFQSANASPDLDRALAMTEDEYIATINPSGETNDEDGSARLVRGDLTDPQNATVVLELPWGSAQPAEMTSPEAAETGKPMRVYFARNTVSSKKHAPAGMDFGQKLEPAGEYMVVEDRDMSAQGGDGWEYGDITFQNPLVLEHKSTNSTGWKKDLSDMFGGKTGKALSNAVKKAGYDGIVTRDKYGYSETVNLTGVKGVRHDESDATVTIERDEDGSFYAREGGDTIGEIVNYGDEVNVNVLPEARGKGVAVNLAAEFMRENPFFDAGSLTPGGEAVVRAAWRKLKAEQSTTLNQSAQTETQAFKRWFGDSKVVDADGKPLVVYHGTDQQFSEFKKSQDREPGDYGAGFYLTGDKALAQGYAEKRAGDAGEAVVMPLYASIQNPFIINIDTNLTEAQQKFKPIRDKEQAARFTESLIEQGYDGVIVKLRDIDDVTGQIEFEMIEEVVAFRPEQIKSAIGNRGTFDPADPNILNQGDEETPRGSITFGPRRDGVRRFDIKLTAKSDLSTVLHEMGHYYLEVIGDLVQGGKANEALSTDYAVIRDWLGAEEGKPLTVDQHEQFARGFEKYLAEGKAPSIELQTAFARFKRWLVGIYKDLKRLNVDLSPEIRSVFDRLLASQEAIDEAEQALALSQQFSENIQKIMTPEELANYARASQQARDDATDEIEREILKAERRKEQEWYREQRKAVEAEVRAEFEAAPAYQARKYLFSNTPHPQTGKPVKLDTAAVTELFGTKSKQARFLGRARVKTGGMHPETAAFLLGYGNPVEMLADMMSVEGLSAAIKTETDRRMAERYPDPRTSGELAEKALAAVGEREAEVQAIQLRALAREAGRKATQHRIIKEAARQHIARLRLRDAIPYQYQRASAKAARAVEEALLAGNLPKAYEEKERQLMNLHLYREAVKAQDLAEQKRAQAKAYMKAGAKRKRLQEASTENFELAYPDGRIEYAATKTAAKLAEEEGATVTPLFNFLEQVDGLLQKYEFGIPRKAIRQQRESLQQFLAQMAGESIVVNPAEWILKDRAERTNWKDLTIDQLVDVVDMIRQIDQMAKNKLFVLKGDKWAEYEPIRDAIAASIELNGHQAASGAFNRNFKDQIRKWGREWLGFLPADQIARELDGQDDLGPVQEHIVGPVQKSAREAVIREKLEMNSLAELVRQFYGEDDIKGMHDAGKLIAIHEIGDTMTRMQMVMLMANLGNEGNRAALLEGTYPNGKRPWTAETIQAVMARLDSNDADFVEALWAWVDKFWPEIAEAEAKRTGVAPPKVEGSPYPVKLADGKVRVLKGGYFPLKYDGEASIKTSQDDVGNAFKNMTAGRTAKAYTPDGHRIERKGSNNRPVKLDFSVLTGHVGNIVRDLTMTDPINQAWRFLHDTTVQGAFERANTKELHTALEIWMQDSAEGEKVDSGYMTASARWLRTGFTANVMLFNLANSLLNLAGTHPLVVLGKRWAMHGYRAAFMPANWEQMYELSSYMREARVESYSKDLALVQDQMAGKGGWRAAMTAAGFYLHNKTQQFMDAVVWMGAYEKGMSLDLVGQALIDYADQRVVEASGSGVFADRSALERGTLSRQTRQNEIVRGLTTLAGYMIRKMAIARRRTAETDFKDIAQAMTWAVDMALLFTIEGLAFAFVKGNVPDEDEDEQAKEWAKTAGWETFASVGSGLPPFGRPVVSAIQGFGGGSTSVDIFSEQFGNAIQQIKQGDADTTALKALVALTGTATKTPGIATNRVIDWLDRAQDGETPPWWELFTGNRNK